MIGWRCAATSLVGALLLSGCVGDDAPPLNTTGWRGPDDYFVSYKLTPPDTNTTTVCHGYGCRYKTQVQFSGADLEKIRAAFAANAVNAAAEREEIAKAIAYFEKKTGALIGTADDPGGVLENQYIGDPTRQDCVDEAATTTGYLVLLENNGILKFHSVREPEVRGIFIDGRWQHFTAVVQEKETKTRYAIDSWFRANGQPAVVMTLRDWLLDYTPASAKQLPEEA